MRYYTHFSRFFARIMNQIVVFCNWASFVKRVSKMGSVGNRGPSSPNFVIELEIGF